MEFKELQDAVFKNAERYSKKHGVYINDEFAMFKLMEETGELAEAFLTYKKKSRPEKYVSEEKSKLDVAKELADVLNVVIILAKLLEIDLEEAVEKKIITREWNKK